MTVLEKCEELAAELTRIEAEDYRRRFPGSTISPDKVVVKPRKKYIALDIGASGAFLVDAADGEIYNIKAYGVPDKNKKLKANIGNVFTVDPAAMHGRRFNYLK